MTRTVQLITFILCAYISSANAWKIVADFEGYAPGDRARGQDAFSHTTNDVVDNGISPYSGDGVAKLDIKSDSGGGYGSWGGIFDFPEPLRKGDEVWYRVNIWFPSGFSYDANPFLKFLRINTDPGHLDWYINRSGSEYPFQFIYEGELVWSRFGGEEDRIKFDTWETYEMYMKLDDVPTSEGGTALVRVWKNGKLLGEFKDRMTLKTPTTEAEYALLFTYWNGENPPTQHLWVDDIVITNEVPSNRDAQGNPMVGVDFSSNVGFRSRPAKITNLTVEQQ